MSKGECADLEELLRRASERQAELRSSSGHSSNGDRNEESRKNWGFFWLTTGTSALLALVPTSALPGWSIVVLGIAAVVSYFLSLAYFSWTRTHRYRSALLSVLMLGVVGVLAYRDWPTGRHLKKSQREGLALIRDALPQACGVLVYVPVESKEAQAYGKEIQKAMTAHGKRANLVYAAAFTPPTGLVVGVRSELDPCGQAGENVEFQLTHLLDIPARIEEGFPYAAENVIVVFVGLRPTYE